MSVAIVLVSAVPVACQGVVGEAVNGEGGAAASGTSDSGGASPGPGASTSSGADVGNGGAGAGSYAAGGGSATSSSTTSSTSTSSTSAGAGGEPTGGVVQQCVDRINAFRATLGLPPYARWVEAESCTDGQAQSDGASNSSHGAFGACGERAQNECPGWGAPAENMIGGCLQQMWDEGPGEPFSEHGHYINMSSTQYTRVACGFHTFPNGTVWAVQNFR